MPHEISIIDGVAEAMFAMKPAWHGLGKVLESPPDSFTAIREAHLDWNVAKEPIQTVGGAPIEDQFATVRQDTGNVLGIVSDRYQIVQNREAFDFLDSLLQDGIMRYESAGALRGGRIVWLLGRLPSVDTIAEGDNSLRYVLFQTSHDGRMSIHAIPTAVRVVCANTLRIAVANDIGFRHTGDVKQKMEFARAYLSQFDAKFTLFRDQAQILATRRYSAEQAKDFIEELFPSISEEGRAKTLRENKIEAVRIAMRSERQNLPSIRGTWWSLVNGVTESIDHKGIRNDDLEKREKRMVSLVDGTAADFKRRAFDLAVTMSA